MVPSQESVNLSLEAVSVCPEIILFLNLKVSLDRSSRQYTSLIHEFFTSCCRYNDVNFFFAAHQAFLDKASKRLLIFFLEKETRILSLFSVNSYFEDQYMFTCKHYLSLSLSLFEES